MQKTLILGSVLTFGVVLQAFGQAPAGYVSLDDVEIEQHVPATAAVIGTTPPKLPEPAALKPQATQAALPPKAEPAQATVPAVATSEPERPKTIAAAVEPPKPVFEARTGASLRKTLETWARQSGWTEVAWKLPADVDFTLGMDGTFDGDFMTATRAFVDALGCEAELRVLFNQKTKVALVEPI